MVSEGARSPAGSAAAKKEPPSATHGSLVVIEHRRTHETIVRCSLFALQSRTPSHTKAPRGPPFRPDACQNAARVVTSHRPPSDISQKQRNRAKAPPPAPRARFCEMSRAEWGVRGLGAWGGGFGAVSLFLRYIAWWLVRSGNPYYVFACDLTKRGSALCFCAGGGASFECGIATPYGGFVCSTMLDND